MNDTTEDAARNNVCRMFDLYKRYMDQENNLLNQRITWMLLIQGFLLAMFGTILTKKDIYLDDTLRHLGAHTIDSFVVVIALAGICLIGMWVALLSRDSIKAAVDAQRNLSNIWEQNFLSSATTYGLPLLVDGGKKDPKERGSSFGTNLPLRCVAMWAIFLALLFGAFADLTSLCILKRNLFEFFFMYNF